MIKQKETKIELNTPEEIINKIEKLFPELLVEENNTKKIKMLNTKGELEPLEFTTMNLQERLCYSITTGRHHSKQNYKNFYLEYQMYMNETELGKKYIFDYIIKDLKNENILLIGENKILKSKENEKLKDKYLETLIQEFNYIFSIFDNKKEDISNKGLFIQTNIYNPEVLFINKKQYENYMITQKQKTTTSEIFKNTGIFQSLFYFEKEELLKLKDKYSNITKQNIKEIYEKELKNKLLDSTNVSMLYLEDIEKISFKNEKEAFRIKLNETIKNKFALEKLPFRSVQIGGSPYDNIREIDEIKVKNYEKSILKNFVEYLYDNNFEENDKIIKSDLSRPGWNDRQLNATFKTTLIDENDKDILIISSDIALSNEQHNTYALLNLKNDLKKIGLNNIEEIKNLIKKSGYTNYEELKENDIEILYKYIENINPILSFNLFSKPNNGRRYAKVNNSISSQSTFDKAKYSEQVKLKMLANEMNKYNSEYHFYSGVDISQDKKLLITNTIKYFDITKLILINSSIKKGTMINTDKKEFKNRMSELRKSLEKRNISDKKTNEELKSFLIYKNLLISSTRNLENQRAIRELYEENTIQDTKLVKNIKEELIDYLEEQKNSFNIIEVKEALKIINKFPKNISNKYLSEEIRKTKLMFENIINSHELGIKFNFNIKATENFIEKLINTTIEIKYKRLLSLVNLYYYISNEVKEINNEKKVLDEDTIIKLIFTTIGYIEKDNKKFFHDEKNYEKDMNKVKEIVKIMKENISNNPNTNVSSLRNKNNLLITEEEMLTIANLFKGLNI